MRLIDTDKLFEDIQQTITELSNTIDWLKLIDQQPTAYDPGKVVEQMNDRSTLSRPVGWPKSYEIITLDDAIEIVKGGGVND